MLKTYAISRVTVPMYSPGHSIHTTLLQDLQAEETRLYVHCDDLRPDLDEVRAIASSEAFLTKIS